MKDDETQDRRSLLEDLRKKIVEKIAERALRRAEGEEWEGEPYYSEEGDCLFYFFREDESYLDHVDNTLTVYRSIETNELTGVKLKGIKARLNLLGELTRAELARIGKGLRTQSNRATSNPIFVVQQKRRSYGYRLDCADNYEWVNSASGRTAEPEEAERLDAGEELATEWEKLGYVDRWEFVQPFLTEEGAERFIKENDHNLKEPRIFVYSGNRNREWMVLRKELMSRRRKND